MKTSQKFSKQLKDNGCELESELWHMERHDNLVGKPKIAFDVMFNGNLIFPAYDILNDICVKYAKEFFGDGKGCYLYQGISIVLINIFVMLQQSKPQDEIEKYIWDVCLFNPKNRKENE